MRRLLALVAAFAAALLAIAPATAASQSVIPVPLDYFGLHCNGCSSPTPYGQPTTPWPAIGEKVMRLWDSGVTWKMIEPKRKAWNWSRLDQLVALDEAHGVETALTLGQTPDYCAQSSSTDLQYNPAPPTDDDDGDKCWREYVTAVATRYGARIHFWTIWNEPDTGGWSGPASSVTQLVRLASIAYPIIKANAPGAVVMNPDMSVLNAPTQLKPINYALYLAAGGGAYMDAFALHAYPGDGVRPELVLGELDALRGYLDRAGLSALPIYDTEDGSRGWRDFYGTLHNSGPWPSGWQDWLPQAANVGGRIVDLQAAYVTRQYLVTLSSGLLSGSWYYTFDNPDGTSGSASVMGIGMVLAPSAPGALRSPALAYRTIAQLLPGGWVEPIRSVGNHYEEDFSTAGGRLGRAYWCDDYTTETVTDAAAVSEVDNLGNPMTLTGGSVVVTGSPVFVFYS